MVQKPRRRVETAKLHAKLFFFQNMKDFHAWHASYRSIFFPILFGQKAMSLPDHLLSQIQFLKNPIFDRTTPLRRTGAILPCAFLVFQMTRGG